MDNFIFIKELLKIMKFNYIKIIFILIYYIRFINIPLLSKSSLCASLIFHEHSISNHILIINEKMFWISNRSLTFIYRLEKNKKNYLS